MTPAEFYVSSDAFNSTLACKSLLNTLAKAVEQLAGCLAQQAKVSSRGQSTTDRQRQHEGLKCVMNI